MATSGSQNFSQTRDQIIDDAFQLLGVYGIGRTISAEDNAFANNLLNKMIKAWGTKGLHLWTKEEAVLYVTANTAKYSLGNSSSDAFATLQSDEIMTQLNGAHIATDTTLAVDSTTGMAASDNIGVVLADNTLFWTTITSVDSSTALTIASGLSGAANDNAYIFTFTNRIYKPLRILSCRRATGIDLGSTSTKTTIPMEMLSYQTYMDFPNKSSTGSPIDALYVPQNTTGDFYLWPRPTDCSERIEFSYERIIEDVDNASDDFDFPAEWLEPLTYQLAIRLGPAFGKEKRAQNLLPLASQMLENLLNWDAEIESVTIMPEL